MRRWGFILGWLLLFVLGDPAWAGLSPEATAIQKRLESKTQFG